MGKHAFINTLQPGPVSSTYGVRESRIRETTKGDAYLALTLYDKSGEIPAKFWQAKPEDANNMKPGTTIEVDGNVELYRQRPQVIIKSYTPVVADAKLLALLSSAPSLDSDSILAQVTELLDSIDDADARRLARAYLDDQDFMDRLVHWPAAKMHHHPYKHGLIEHVLSVMKLGAAMCEHYPSLNRDLVLLGLFLHDSGKVVELVSEPVPGYSVEGQLLGHITIGICILDAKCRSLENFPARLRVQLQHIILSHHESAEYGSPKPPMFPEALIVHTIEMLDAKMNAMERELRKPSELADATGEIRFSRLLERHLFSPPSESEPD